MYEEVESFEVDASSELEQLMEDDEISAEEEGFLLGCEMAEQEE